MSIIPQGYDKYGRTIAFFFGPRSLKSANSRQQPSIAVAHHRSDGAGERLFFAANELDVDGLALDPGGEGVAGGSPQRPVPTSRGRDTSPLMSSERGKMPWCPPRAVARRIASGRETPGRPSLVLPAAISAPSRSSSPASSSATWRMSFRYASMNVSPVPGRAAQAHFVLEPQKPPESSLQAYHEPHPAGNRHHRSRPGVSVAPDPVPPGPCSCPAFAENPGATHDSRHRTPAQVSQDLDDRFPLRLYSEPRFSSKDRPPALCSPLPLENNKAPNVQSGARAYPKSPPAYRFTVPFTIPTMAARTTSGRPSHASTTSRKSTGSSRSVVLWLCSETGRKKAGD